MGAPGPVGPAGPSAYTLDNWSFAGFTPTTYTGAVTNGRTGMHSLCAAAFAGSHLCHVAEFVLANTATAAPASGAWLDPSTMDGTSFIPAGLPKAGRHVGGNSCTTWTSSVAGSTGTIIRSTGVVSSADCSTSRPLSCCNGASRARFAGLTVGTMTGNAGGRPAIYALCVTAFGAGAHLCHASEYLRATVSTAPAASVWVDPSTSDGTTPNNSGAPEAGRYFGSSDCSGWTSAGAGSLGLLITTTGTPSTGDCSVARQAACCL